MCLRQMQLYQHPYDIYIQDNYDNNSSECLLCITFILPLSIFIVILKRRHYYLNSTN